MVKPGKLYVPFALEELDGLQVIILTSHVKFWLSTHLFDDATCHTISRFGNNSDQTCYHLTVFVRVPCCAVVDPTWRLGTRNM